MADQILIGRHEKKAKRGAGVEAGSREDIALDLSPEGKLDALRTGANLKIFRSALGDNPYSYIYAVSSDMLRARRTNEQMLVGAGYNFTDPTVVRMVENPNIGLARPVGIKAYDWQPEEAPTFDPKNPDPYVISILINCYRPNPDKPRNPAMAGFMVSQLQELLNGRYYLNLSGRDNGLFLMTTHSPIIDGLANVLNGSLVIDDQGIPHLEDFPGSFQMGERIDGEFVTSKNDPLYVLNVKGKEVRYRKSVLEGMLYLHSHWMNQPLAR